MSGAVGLYTVGGVGADGKCEEKRKKNKSESVHPRPRECVRWGVWEWVPSRE